jgi:integrase
VPDGKARGLYLQLQSSGAKSWAVRYYFEGRPRKLTLGRYPTVDLRAARRLAEQALGDVARGMDPAGAKQATRAAARAERESQIDLVERVVAQFIERHAKAKNRDWRETERALRREVVSRFKGRRLASVTRPQVRAMLDEIAARAPIMANRVLAAFRKMCNWAVAYDLIGTNPCDGLAAPGKETRRDRVLSDDEVKRAWTAFEGVGWPFGAIGKLLLLTGARRDEVAAMRWSEIDVGARAWTLPKERTKNKREHVVPLSDEALALISSLPRIEGKAGYVFTTTGESAVSGFSRAKRAIDRAMGDAALPHWTLHDLRRTVATNLQRLGVRLEVTEAVLNHVGGSRAGIVGVYQRHEYGLEKRAALDAWARRLNEIVAGAGDGQTNVVELRAAT